LFNHEIVRSTTHLLAGWIFEFEEPSFGGRSSPDPWALLLLLGLTLMWAA